MFYNENVYYFLCSHTNPIFEKIFVPEILVKQDHIQGLVWAHLCYRNVGIVYRNNTLWWFKQAWAVEPGIHKVFNSSLRTCRGICIEDMIKLQMLFSISSFLILGTRFGRSNQYTSIWKTWRCHYQNILTQSDCMIF